MDPGELDHGSLPWPDDAIHPYEVQELILDGAYDDAVRERHDRIMREDNWDE